MSPKDDVRTGSPVERTRGMTFYPAKFSATLFAASHEHCINDWRTIAESGPDTGGYVTFREIKGPEERLGRQYLWVCAHCFDRLRETMDWKIGGKLPPGPSEQTNWARRPVPRSQSERERLSNDFPYALVGWSAEEVVAIANSQKLQISKDDATELLLNSERKIEAVMTNAGHELILRLVHDAILPDD